MWEQSVRSGAATTRGLSSGSTLLDLRKAYELVRLELVWKAAINIRAPLHVLRLEIQAYTAVRHLQDGGVLSNACQTDSAIVAGGTFATDCLFITLYDSCDRILIEHVPIQLSLYVDDIALHIFGKAGEAALCLLAATQDLIKAFEEVLTLSVSRSKKAWELDDSAKTIFLASPELEQRLEPAMRSVGIRTEHPSTLLG